MRQKNYEKGITLIALIITIIILLILAGLTLNIVINTGIMDKTETAVDEYSKEQVKESLNLAILNYKMGQITGEGKTFEEIISEIGGTATHNEAEKTYTVILDGYEFTIDDSTFEIKGSKEGETSGGTETPETPEVTEYTITVEENENVTVTGGGKVEKGQSVTISATVASGYVFNGWTITSGTGTIADEKSASTTVTPTSNITIKAIVGKTKVIANGDNTEISEESTNVTITGGDFEPTNPVIPVGFETSDEGASWEDANNDGIVDGWNDGLVIQDETGNQFVWVPVDGTDVTYTKWTSSSGNFANHLKCSDDSLPSRITSEDTQITEYGGFYIARYEAGIPTTLTAALATASEEARNVSGIPVSKRNQVPWNYIDYTTSKANAESMYTLANTNNHVQSGLVTGTQWDATMKWLENASINVQENSTEWGNYKNVTVTGITEYSEDYGASWTTTSSTTKGYGTKWLLKTGNTEYTNRKNIYDLAGNLIEWTNEIYNYSSTINYRVQRGCSLSQHYEHPAASREYGSYDGNADDVGFRCVLYIQ